MDNLDRNPPAPTDADSSEKDWAQYYQSLETYHTQHNYQQQPQWPYPGQQPLPPLPATTTTYPYTSNMPPPLSSPVAANNIVSSQRPHPQAYHPYNATSRRSTSITRGVTKKVSDLTLQDIEKTNVRAKLEPAYTSIKIAKKNEPKPIAQTTSTDDSDLAAPLSEWPDSLKRFVERSFAACPESARSRLETQLKQIIASASNNNKIHSMDWDARPLPKACQLGLNKQQKQHQLLASKNILKEKGQAKASGFAGQTMGGGDFDSEERKQQRLLRFQREEAIAKKAMEESKLATTMEPPVSHMNDVHDWDADTIVGTCTKLEKSYLRLTSAPDPAVVRPLPILRKTLELLKQRYIADRNYSYICDQFKSLRQDLTVQRITNKFTVEVYELHARIALETNDLGEYNQCQTQLMQLYKMGLHSDYAMEFLAYRILYYLYTRNGSDINTALAAMTAEEQQNDAVRHALEVRKAMATGNYHRFFCLYSTAPNMGAFLMDNFVNRERTAAFQKMCKAYRPRLGVDFIAKELGFANEIDQCVKFLASMNIDSTSDQQQPPVIDMKAAYPHVATAMQKYEKIDIKGQKY